MAERIGIEVRAKDAATKELRKMSKQIQGTFRNVSSAAIAVSAAVAGIVGGLGALVLRAASAADDMATLAAQTGLTVEQLQDLQTVALGTGTKSDTMARGIQALEQNLEDAKVAGTDIAEALGKRGLNMVIADLNGKLRPMAELFPEIITALRNVEDPIKRSQLAAKIFGRALALDLIPMLAITDEQAQEIIKRMDAMVPKLSDEQVAALAEASAAWKLFGQAFERVRGHIAAELLPLFNELIGFMEQRFKPAFEKVRGAVRDLVQAFNDLDPGVKEFMAKSLGLIAGVAAVGTVFKLAGFLGTGLAWVMGPLLSPLVRKLAKLFLFLGKHPILLVIGGLALLAIAAFQLFDDWDDFKTQALALWKSLTQWISDTLGNLAQFFRDWGDETNNDFLRWIGDLFAGLQEVWGAIVVMIEAALMLLWHELIEPIAAAILAVWEVWGDDIVRLGGEAWELIKSIIGTALGIIRDVVLAFAALFTGDWETFWSKVGDIFRGLWKILMEDLPVLLGNLLILALGLIGTLLIELGKAMWEGSKAVGNSLVDGIRSGISAGWAALTRWVREKVDALVGSIKGALKISSPSKVMMELGSQTMEGFRLGMEKQFKGARSTLMGGVGGMVPAVAGAGSRSAVFSPTFHINGSNMTERDFQRMLQTWWGRATRAGGL